MRSWVRWWGCTLLLVLEVTGGCGTTPVEITFTREAYINGDRQPLDLYLVAVPRNVENNDCWGPGAQPDSNTYFENQTDFTKKLPCWKVGLLGTDEKKESVSKKINVQVKEDPTIYVFGDFVDKNNVRVVTQPVVLQHALFLKTRPIVIHVGTDSLSRCDNKQN